MRHTCAEKRLNKRVFKLALANASRHSLKSIRIWDAKSAKSIVDKIALIIELLLDSLLDSATRFATRLAKRG